MLSYLIQIGIDEHSLFIYWVFEDRFGLASYLRQHKKRMDIATRRITANAFDYDEKILLFQLMEYCQRQPESML